MRRRFPIKILPLIGLILLILVIPLNVDLVKNIQYYISKATGQEANILVDASSDQGSIAPIWRALSQGGEEKYPFETIIGETSALSPRYIRIDHLYDFYNVIRKENGRLLFNWSELDRVINQIIIFGAKPFFSLSYMPSAIAKDGKITAPPNDWNDWATVVRETIQHYSGRNDWNLEDVIYEVWNEPDLFGDWKMGGKNDYRTLYRYAVIGANQTQNTNLFKIGGPAITAPYKNWLNDFLDYVANSKLRLDFYSWHRYSLNPEKFLEDVDKIDTWLFQNAGHAVEKYLTEWGSVSEKSPIHDQNYDAAHLVSAIRRLIQRVDLALTFEIKDGLSPEGRKYWGSWGLLTHEKAGLVEKKPKYYALQLLNKMVGNRLALDGEGDWITGFAAKDQGKIIIILSNLDYNGQHFELTPVAVNNLENGYYSYKEFFLNGSESNSIEKVDDRILKKRIPLSPNNVVVIELTKI